jgi:hypothetical protein
MWTSLLSSTSSRPHSRRRQTTPLSYFSRVGKNFQNGAFFRPHGIVDSRYGPSPLNKGVFDLTLRGLVAKVEQKVAILNFPVYQAFI